MLCLGIESTAHTFGAGIVDSKGKVLANVKDTYTTVSGGIHPSEAKLHHLRVKDNVIMQALDQANIKKKDISIISFSQGPGLPPCLVVGMETAKNVSAELKIPVIGVNHCIAHLEIGRLRTGARDPVLLYTSGANTQIIAYEGGKFRIFGETLDQGVGNFIDSFARHIGLGFPGGPKIQELAERGKNYIEIPYVVKGMDVSFSGMLTNLKQKYDSGKYEKEELAHSLQETAFAMLLEVSERAIFHCQKKELLLGGGVACNKRLQEMTRTMCKEAGLKFFVPENEFLVDNGAMIAWQGMLEYGAKSSKREDGNAGSRELRYLDEIDIRPNWRTDQVVVKYR